MKAIILARVSTEEQKEAGNSLPAQQARLLQYVQRNNQLTLDKEFIFDESAYKEKRDKFDVVTDYIGKQKEIVALCCDKVDRLSRDFLVGLPQLEKMRREGKIELHLPSDNLVLHKDSPATDLFHFNIAVSLAQYYSNSISDNVKRAYEQKIRNGEWIGKSPLGYKNIDLESGRKHVVPDADRAHLIVKLFELYATGKYSMKGLAREMKKMGLRNRDTNSEVSTSQIEGILKNPFYYGEMRIKGVKYPHKYEPLISLNLYNKAHEVIRGYNRQNFKRTNKPYIFRGLIKCSECGCAITPEIHKGKYIYYHCTNYHGNCKNVEWIREEELVEQIKHLFKSLKLAPHAIEKLKQELRTIHEAENQYYKKNLNSIKRRLNAIDSKLKIMYEDRLEGRLSVEEYDKMLIERKKEQQELLSRYSEHTDADKNFYIASSKILDFSQKAWDLFKISEVEEKTQLLNFLLQNLSLKGRNLEFEVKNPFSGIQEYAKTNSMLRVVDSVRTAIQQQKEYIYMPKLNLS